MSSHDFGSSKQWNENPESLFIISDHYTENTDGRIHS